MSGSKDKYIDHKLVRYGPRNAMRDCWGFLCLFFSWHNIRHAFRCVIGGFREYAVFYIALLAVQMLFWSVSIYTTSYAATAKQIAYSTCDYHLLVDGLTDSEWSAIYNAKFMIKDKLDPEQRGYISYKVEQYTDRHGSQFLQVRFLLLEDTKRAANDFMTINSVTGKEAHRYYSARATYGESVVRVQLLGVAITIVLGALSVLILLSLFRIRMNHFKFRYGVYMSFGADFEKLFETAIWELFAISVITALPSVAITYLIFRAVILSGGGNVAFDAGAIPYSFLFTYLVILLAVLPSVRILAGKSPITLLSAQDNANLVMSPRRSFRIFGKSFPVHYELFGFWRFRRYYAGLLVSAVIFSSFFLCGIFVSDMVHIDYESPDRQFTVSAGGAEIDEADMEEIINTDGVSFVYWDSSVSATLLRSHAVLTAEQAAGISSLTVPAQQQGMEASCNFKYVSYSEIQLKTAMKSGMWKVDGDIESIFNSENTVIVSQQINNTDLLNFKVGDTITIALFDIAKSPISFDSSDKRIILSQLVNNTYFNFITVTVGAVIDTDDSDDEFIIGMPEKLYTELTGRSPSVKSVDIYLERGLEHKDVLASFESIRRIMTDYPEYDLTDSRADFTYAVNTGCGVRFALLLCASLVLLISPLIWFFSQSMFGSKRDGELFILSSFGATDSAMLRMHIFDGLCLAILGAIIAVLLGSSLSYLVYRIINQILPSFGFDTGSGYVYKISYAGLGISVVLSVLSAMLSTCLPLLGYRRRRDRIIRRASGER